jgi:hypothetical protein
MLGLRRGGRASGALSTLRQHEDVARGPAEANATLTRRTLTVTSAPIFNSCKRTVPQVARSSLVPASPMRRTAHIST